MNSLNDLFEEILHSEQHFTKQIHQLRELGAQLNEAQLELRKACTQTRAMQGELVLKNQKLADSEVDKRLQEVKKLILEEQKTRLSVKQQQLSEELGKLESATEQQRAEFLSEVIEFNQCYDLTGNGIKYREHQAKKKVAILQYELELLNNEFSEIKIQLKEVEKLNQKISEIEKSIDEEKVKQKEARSVIQSLRHEISCLEKEKSTSSSKECIDISRLQKELEDCRNCPEESECHRLKKELEELQRISYQRQMNYSHSRRNTTTGTQHRSAQMPSYVNRSRPVTSNHMNLSRLSRTAADLGRKRDENTTTMHSNAAVDEDEFVDDEWFKADEDVCQDWELQALAEASELTDLVMDDEDDDDAFMEEDNAKRPLDVTRNRKSKDSTIHHLPQLNRSFSASQRQPFVSSGAARASSLTPPPLPPPLQYVPTHKPLDDADHSGKRPRQLSSTFFPTQTRASKPAKRVRFHY